jgi:hypothetical protein
MAVKPHGVRARYNEGCRCEECKEFNREYWRDYRARKATGDVISRSERSLAALASPPAEDSGPGRVESGVLAEIEGLAQAETRPGLVEMALELARVMDNPKAVSQKPAASKALAELLATLRKGADARRSRLASVRAMTRPGSATG